MAEMNRSLRPDMDRRDVLLSLFDASGVGLEIGAGYNPLLAKSAGYRVETLDHATQAELQVKYASNPGADASAIEPVDHVSDGRSMVEVIGRTSHYDFIVASHVIEHAPDMVGFLDDCARLLKPGGVLVLAVPDMRYCFDRFRPRSSLGALVEAHCERRTKQTRASLFDRIAYNSRLDDRTGWSKDSVGTFRLQYDLVEAPAFAARHDTEGYIDGHSWQFTPSSFRCIVEDLHALGFISLREARFEETPIFEFFIVLSPDGEGPGFTRLALLERTLDEQAQASDAFRALEERQAVPVRHDDVEAALRAEIAKLRDENQALLASSSWRLTRPLRAARRLLGRQ